MHLQDNCPCSKRLLGCVGREALGIVAKECGGNDAGNSDTECPCFSPHLTAEMRGHLQGCPY